METKEQGLSRWTDILEKQIRDCGKVQLADVQEALAHITEESDKGLYGLCNYYMAYYLIKNGRSEECLEYLKECIRCMVGTSQEIHVSRGYNLFGVIAHSQNNLLMAVEQYNKALDYAEEYQDHLMRNIINSNMADVYYRLGAYERAFACCRESIKEFELSGDDSAVGKENYMMLLASYGYCLTMAGELEEAGKIRGRLAAMQEERYGEIFPTLYVYTFFALYSHRTGRDQEAFQHLQMAVEDAMARQWLSGDSDGILNLLDLMVEMKKFGYLKEVLDWVEPIAEEERKDGLILQLLFYRLKYCRDSMTEEQYKADSRLFFKVQQAQTDSEAEVVLGMMEMCRCLWAVEEEKRQLEQENLRLLHQVDHDELSGLYNKRCLNRYTDEIFDRAKQEKKPVSILFIDIDHFKQLNDRYGHQTGDACIRAVAESIRESMPEDFAARYGGDEFVVVAFDRTEEQVRGGADRIVEKVKRRNIPHLDSPVSDVLTVTVGAIHAVPRSSSRSWDFMAAADETLYRQKKERKGCARFCAKLG